MTFDFTEKRKVKINMDNYVERKNIDSPMKISKSGMALNPAGVIFLKKLTSTGWVKKKLNSFIIQ